MEERQEKERTRELFTRIPNALFLMTYRPLTKGSNAEAVCRRLRMCLTHFFVRFVTLTRLAQPTPIRVGNPVSNMGPRGTEAASICPPLKEPVAPVWAIFGTTKLRLNAGLKSRVRMCCVDGVMRSIPRRCRYGYAGQQASERLFNVHT